MFRMCVFRKVCLVLVLLFAPGYCRKPQILRENGTLDDIILNSGDSITFTCVGESPLDWIIKEPDLSNVIISPIIIDDDNSYKKTLQITNASYKNVRYYSCQFQDDTESDRIYLFVNDPDHLSTIETEFQVINGIQNQPVIIPCRPTSPNITVTLEATASDILTDEEKTLDPKVGFTFMVKDLSYTDTYTCEFMSKIDGTSSVVQFTLIVDSPTTLPKPFIQEVSQNHTEVGNTLELNCTIYSDSRRIQFVWKTPRGNFESNSRNNQRVEVESTKRISINSQTHMSSVIKIYDVALSDAGIYVCEVSDGQDNTEESETFVVIRRDDECSVQIRAQNGESVVQIGAGESAQWVLHIAAHPPAKLTWYDYNGHEIQNDNVYQMDVDDNSAKFKIENTSLLGPGRFRVHGTSARYNRDPQCHDEIDYYLTLIVEDKPTVCIDNNCQSNIERILLKNQDVKLQCSTRGYPVPIINWETAECATCAYSETQALDEHSNDTYSTSFLQINSSKDGALKCIGSNSLASQETTLIYYISEFQDGFQMFDFGTDAIVNEEDSDLKVTVAENGVISFTCGLSLKKSKELEIFVNDTKLPETYVEDTYGDYSSRKKVVRIKGVQKPDSGTYSCRIKNMNDNSYEYKNATFEVKEPFPPLIYDTNLDEDVVIDYPKMKYSLYCNTSAIPKPNLQWYKDGLPIPKSERIQFNNDNMLLTFDPTDVTDEGTYSCEAFNYLGRVTKSANLTFKVKPVHLAVYYYILGIIGLLLLVALIFIAIRIKKERELRRELKLLGLENFHKGNPENLNPDLGIDDQAELLPYNKDYEFPIAQLKIGKQLGSGAFGVVMKAEAYGLVRGETKTTVAVKMVKKNADQSYIKALASELKVMIHLGKHVNVVNLLGACTKNVARRELLVLVEFCRFGNLQNYLFKHRQSFINQVDPVTGEVNFSIGAEALEKPITAFEMRRSTLRSQSVDYRDRAHTASSNMTEMTSLGDNESVMLSNSNNSQPEWRLNYRGDYKGYVKPICTKDLLTWAFQVARGMDYLASRKVLHGDLAARNILLADNNIVKICDFGLAKNMYKDNNYKKKSNGPLPVKWMAVESIRDRVFSTQSDVWSYGVVLWEFFSLARNPYPGMDADERLYHKLVEGYRMESPNFAPKNMYKIMLDCWNTKPLQRPSFATLTDTIGSQLEDGVRQHYVDLNDPYLKINVEKMEETDYLGMLSPPSFDVLSTPLPRYVNLDMQQSPSGYVPMDPSAVFIPKVQQPEVFNFRTSDLSPQELRPMLHSNNESDSETPSGYLIPSSPIGSVSNPSYLHLPQVATGQVPQTPRDNYITMPEYKNLVNDNNLKESDNGRINMNTNNVHYVNNDASIWNSVDV